MAIGCNALVGWGDFTKSSPNKEGDVDGTSSSGDVGQGTSGTSGTSGTVGSGSVPKCTLTKPFAAPIPINGKVNTSAHETAPSLTADELTMFFQRTVGADGGNILQSTRASVNDPWGDPVELTELAQSGVDYSPAVTGDGLELVWAEMASGPNPTKLKIATRATAAEKFSNVRVLDAVSNAASADDTAPSLSADGKELFFTSTRVGGARHLFHSVVGGDALTFQAPQILNELASGQATDAQLAMTADGLTIYFASERPGGLGNADVWTATRSTRVGNFSAPVHVADPINSASYDWPTWLSPDGCRLYMSVLPVDGAGDIVVATRPL